MFYNFFKRTLLRSSATTRELYRKIICFYLIKCNILFYCCQDIGNFILFKVLYKIAKMYFSQQRYMVSVSPNSCHTLSVKAASLICIMINATLFIEDRELGILTLHVLFKISLICIKLQKHICLICFFKRKISERYVFLSSVTQMFSCA